MKCEYCGSENVGLEWEVEFDVKSLWNDLSTPSLYFCDEECFINWMFEDGLLHRIGGQNDKYFVLYPINPKNKIKADKENE